MNYMQQTSEFEGLKVVEIASVLAGPAVGMFFSELGAEVIKIEHKLIGGDVTRSWKLPNESKESNVSAYFSSVNYKKKYEFRNFKDFTDLEYVVDLVKEADILITNFKKGDDFKFGLDYTSLKSLNPGLIYAAISGFGTDSDRVAYDLILQAETGYMSMNGTSDSGPVKMPVALIDVLAAHQLKEGILIALINRMKDGLGTKVDVSLYNAAVCSLANQASNWLMAQHIAQPIGSLHPNIAPYGELFLTKDKVQITFAIGSNKQFGALMEYLDLAQFITDKRFISNKDRVNNRTELKTLLEERISGLNAEDILDHAHLNYIPAAEIKNMKTVFEDKKSQQLILKETISGIPTSRVSTVAFKLSRD